MAEAGLFEIASELPNIKAATAYAMAIYKIGKSSEVEEQMDEIIANIIEASDSNQVAVLINNSNLLRVR